MTIIEISALIPLEVYAMHSHFSNWRLGAFVLNVLIVIYLLKNRQLFHGIHETADSVDPA